MESWAAQRIAAAGVRPAAGSAPPRGLLARVQGFVLCAAFAVTVWGLRVGEGCGPDAAGPGPGGDARKERGGREFLPARGEREGLRGEGAARPGSPSVRGYC